jgi:hypothetical protein
MADSNGDESLCTKNAPWTAVRNSTEPAEAPSVEAHNDTQAPGAASTAVDGNVTSTTVVVVTCFGLLSVLIVIFFLVRHSKVVTNFCRRANMFK